MSLEFVKILLKENEKLLYLTYFGSHLYGTHDENSDVDYKGIFLPSKKDLLLNKSRKSINWKSGNNVEKNSSDDVDVELWSIHYFLELLSKGETNAIDLVYSPSNKDCVIYQDELVRPVFDNPLSLFDPGEITPLIRYVYSQMKKYGLKGSRLGVIKRIYNYLKQDIINELFDENLLEKKLKVIADDILENFYDGSYCFQKEINGENALVICGKVHLYSIKIAEFYNRIKREYEKYGHRADLAEQNKGIDWKCVMHSYRCAFQMIELLEQGKVTYPLKQKEFLKKVKDAKIDFKECEKEILNFIEQIEQLRNSKNIYRGNYDSDFVNKMILSLYGL